MISSNPGASETMSNPYPQNSYTVPGSPGLINPGNQVQGGHVPFITTPGIMVANQQGQGNTQEINPAAAQGTRKFKEEAKALGAIQILIGIAHIGFGIILGLLSYSEIYQWGYASITFISFYPFWGGLCFIVSGSLSVSASKELSSCLLKGTLGMNIVSAIFAIPGVIMLLVDVLINGVPEQTYWALISGKGISSMLIILSLLVFCINCATAHFARRAITATRRPVVIVPAVYTVGLMAPGSSSAPPITDGYPAYSNNN
ncbi:membrane-spanning 4-domains subfamily A member 12 [Ochotona princeps]|uniref:membrane-spanning 4-domains subfamily A member 12 n=1 Tax=Ochotona princeps TaxID=9978 RepID=UPI00271462D9|nr:membrane-spanning 4-domains subfamily A member 12 [Ochotona princeps]